MQSPVKLAGQPQGVLQQYRQRIGRQNGRSGQNSLTLVIETNMLGWFDLGSIAEARDIAQNYSITYYLQQLQIPGLSLIMARTIHKNLAVMFGVRRIS